MSWGDAALATIQKIHARMPDVTKAELRLVLRRNAKAFHGGTSWGKTVWAKQSKLYLASLGDTPNPPLAPGQFPDDICFPWKGESTGGQVQA